MSQNNRLNGLSSLPATGVPRGGNIRKPLGETILANDERSSRRSRASKSIRSGGSILQQEHLNG